MLLQHQPDQQRQRAQRPREKAGGELGHVKHRKHHRGQHDRRLQVRLKQDKHHRETHRKGQFAQHPEGLPDRADFGPDEEAGGDEQHGNLRGLRGLEREESEIQPPRQTWHLDACQFPASPPANGRLNA